MGSYSNVYLDNMATAFARLAIAAGEIAMRHYCAGGPVRTKIDDSPVTKADEEVEEFLLAALAEQFPDLPVVAEEQASSGYVPTCSGSFLLVDPIDGTREFLRENGEFTVNIALIEDGVPRAGAVFAPAVGRLWFGGAHAYVCDFKPGSALPDSDGLHEIHARPCAANEGLVVLESRNHSDERAEAFLQKVPVKDRRKSGSSMKFCILAEGQADLYPRFGPTMEWDTAAGDAVLRAAGGFVLDEHGHLLVYGKQADGFRNPAFLAWGTSPIETNN